jgi:hypothetical protein
MFNDKYHVKATMLTLSISSIYVFLYLGKQGLVYMFYMFQQKYI